ncbi:predicted protein [Chaetomium globosum CBS 148.51]|uniref:Uncharacterized protein n=1 Tax=Chaetomium globosum (strain ATCC 6205 / CBS 148.51 / DSM 1962 / NBRC 6347 / NRRL 1970) TaxID=306901 RepID=Q2H7C7_CHAGB|nr:uncharacterized protein CHGG_05438 [Chaetomium globosum CBS 148.51]EAQ88819.1 predicted protein [Chaetomium globosum CBS 148.51]
MCRKYQRIGRCGHVYRESWSPSDPRDCSTARARARRTGNAARHCRHSDSGGRSTHVTSDNTQVCNSTTCYRDYILRTNGWTCHKCGGQNSGTSRSCVHSDVVDYSSGSSSSGGGGYEDG